MASRDDAKYTEEKIVNIRELNIQELEQSCTWVCIGTPGSGKSTLMEALAYYNKHKYPVGRFFAGTSGGYKKWCKIFGDLYVTLDYDEQAERSHIIRQRTVELDMECPCDSKKTCPHSTGLYAINFIDDAGDDPRVYKTKIMRGLFKLGSQHYNQLLVVGSQYAIDMPVDIRPSINYVALFQQQSPEQLKKLYLNFGGAAGSFDVFCQLMKQLTGDYTCMIIKQRTQSNNLEDNIFYARTTVLKPGWKFGCKEYRNWSRSRYDPSYRDKSPLDDI